MATQSAGTSPKTKRLGIFPRSFRKFIFVFVILLFLVAGAVWIWQVWGTISNVLGVIFTVAGVIGTILTLWPSSEAAKDDTPAFHSFIQQTQPQTPVQVTIYNNVGQIAGSQSPRSQVISGSNHDMPEGHNINLQAGPTNAPGVNRLVSSPPSPSLSGDYAGNVPPDTAQQSTKLRLSGRERLELTEALLDAYPTQEDFDMMLEVNFDKHLNAFVDIHQDFRKVIFQFTGKTQAEGWTEDLIIAAYETNSGNGMLKNCYHKYIQRRNAQVPGQNTIAESKQPESRQSTREKPVARIHPVLPPLAPVPSSQQNDFQGQQETGLPQEGTKHISSPVTTALSTVGQARADVETAQSCVEQADALFIVGKTASPENLPKARSFLTRARKSISDLEIILDSTTLSLPEPLASNKTDITSHINIVDAQIDKLLESLRKGIHGDSKPLSDALNKIQELISE